MKKINVTGVSISGMQDAAHVAAELYRHLQDHAVYQIDPDWSDDDCADHIVDLYHDGRFTRHLDHRAQDAIAASDGTELVPADGWSS